MNRVILLLNVVVLAVNFMLALSATDSQVGILKSTSEVAYGSRIERRTTYATRDPSLAYLRVVQTLDSVAPRGADLFTTAQLGAVYEAVTSYYEAVGRGVSQALAADDDAEMLRRMHTDLSKSAREEVERTLSVSFRDSAVVKRLATAVIQHCR